MDSCAGSHRSERPPDFLRLDDGDAYLRAQTGKLVVIDEIHRTPALELISRTNAAGLANLAARVAHTAAWLALHTKSTRGERNEMHTVADLLARKGHDVHTITAQARIGDAAQVMFEHGVGSLVVTRGDEVVGIVTRNDLVQALAEKEVEAKRVSDLMTSAVQTTHPAAELRDIRERMLKHGIRHMPVLNGATIAGVITLADVLYLELLAANAMNRHLENYLFGAYF